MQFINRLTLYSNTAIMSVSCYHLGVMALCVVALEVYELIQEIKETASSIIYQCLADTVMRTHLLVDHFAGF